MRLISLLPSTHYPVFKSTQEKPGRKLGTWAVLELTIVAFLIVLNGCSRSELAIDPSTRLVPFDQAEASLLGASTALALAEDPGRFLSTV